MTAKDQIKSTTIYDINRIMEMMGDTATFREAEAMIKIITEAGWSVDTAADIPEDKWLRMREEAVARAAAVACDSQRVSEEASALADRALSGISGDYDWREAGYDSAFDAARAMLGTPGDKTDPVYLLAVDLVASEL